MDKRIAICHRSMTHWVEDPCDFCKQVKAEFARSESKTFSRPATLEEILEIPEVKNHISQAIEEARKEERERVIDLSDGIIFDTDKKNSEQLRFFIKLYDQLQQKEEGK